LVQRVSEASVHVGDAVVGHCGKGLLVLICAMQEDTEADPAAFAARIARLRIFADDAGKMNRSLLDIGGEALVVSQFTLAADTSRGNRPGFSAAAPPERGRALYEFFAEALAAQGVPTARGIFGAEMAVRLVNDGPVTIWLDSRD
jgi:D-aminoacyl-tRNA deacylase